MSNGDMLDFDRANMITTFSRNLDAARHRDPMSSTWLSDRWIRPQPILFSPGDQFVYIGSANVFYKKQGKSSLFDQVEVINSKTMTHVRSVVPGTADHTKGRSSLPFSRLSLTSGSRREGGI